TFEIEGPGNSFDGVTVATGTTVTIQDGASLSLANTIHDVGTIALDSSGQATSLEISGDVTVDSGGAITLSDDTHNSIISDGHTATLHNHVSISGSGTIGDGSGGHLTLDNFDTIKATGSAALILDTGATAIVNEATTGVLAADFGGTLVLKSNITNDGEI